MTLLQPTDVPSRTGINEAITTEIEDHAETDGGTGGHGESAVQVFNANGPDISGTVSIKTILGGRLALLWADITVVNAISVPASGDSADSGRSFPNVTAGYRPAQYLNVPVRTVGTGSVSGYLSFNVSGYLALSRFESQGSSYNIPVGEQIQGQMVYIPEGQDN